MSETMRAAMEAASAWSQPSWSENPFRLANRIQPPAVGDELLGESPPRGFPTELRDLWSVAREAWLGEDIEYGQWGLHLLSPELAAERTLVERGARLEELRADDVVFGEFLGDSDLLLFAPSESESRRLLITGPLDPRSEWYPVGPTIAGFVDAYLAAGAEKYWQS